MEAMSLSDSMRNLPSRVCSATSCSVRRRAKPRSFSPDLPDLDLRVTSCSAHWKSAQKAQPGQMFSDLVPISEVGLSSQRSISGLVEWAAMAERSGPFELPRPRTMWQLEQPPAPKK